MEANEAQEIEERNEEASSSKAMRPVALTMSILAVLVAVVSMLGERAHTDAVINQAKASDQWNLYQAKKNRAFTSRLDRDDMAVLAPNNPAAEKVIKKDDDYVEKEKADADQQTEVAKGFEEKVEHAELYANRFNLSQVLLEIALVITSITLLTHRKIYWYVGFAFAVGGIISALTVLLK